MNSPAVLMDGKALAQKKRHEIKTRVDWLLTQGIVPSLAVIIAGNDPASRKYVDNKKKDCAECGIKSTEIPLGEGVSEAELLQEIERLNADASIDGILVQLPLPSQIDEKTIINAIDPKKDVDAFHPVNVGHIMLGDFTFVPCTPAGVIELLDEYNISPMGKECVVIGRSNIVGKPMAMLLLHRHGTVTICHSRTSDLPKITRRADILICAVGKADFLKADMVKPGAVVIDVGMNMKDGKLTGDADFDEVSAIAGYITPAPGGVGPMTRVMLLKNTLSAAEKRLSRQVVP